MQQALRRITFGDKFWERETTRRTKSLGGRNSNIFEILEGITEEKYRDALETLTSEDGHTGPWHGTSNKKRGGR